MAQEQMVMLKDLDRKSSLKVTTNLISIVQMILTEDSNENRQLSKATTQIYKWMTEVQKWKYRMQFSISLRLRKN